MNLIKSSCLLAILILFSTSILARDSVRLGIHLEPPALDPTMTPSASAGEITYGNIFEGLLIVDGEGQLKPRLASQWQVSDDGLTYTFTLRRGVRFHDNNPFNADVARYSLERMLASDSANPQKILFDKIKSVETVSSYVLRIHLSQPDSFLLLNLALPAAVLVHSDSAATNAKEPIGTGPYKFVEWVSERSVNLQVNNQYWGDKPAIRRVEFLFMQTSVGTESLLTEGLIDGLLGVTRVTNRFMTRPDYQMIPRNIESKMLLAINNARPPFDDINVRRALSHGINREALSRLYGPQYDPELIGSHFSPNHPAYVDLAQRYPYDIEEARRLLSQARIPDDFSLTLTLPPTDYGRYGGLMVADDLEAMGFRVELEQLDWSEWIEKVFQQHDYSLTLIMHVEPMDINIYARDGYYFNYENHVFKDIWNNVLNARSESEFYELLGDAQRQLSEDAVNVFLFMRPERNLMHRNLQGIWMDSYIPSFVLEDLYWSNDR